MDSWKIWIHECNVRPCMIVYFLSACYGGWQWSIRNYCCFTFYCVHYIIIAGLRKIRSWLSSIRCLLYVKLFYRICSAVNYLIFDVLFENRCAYVGWQGVFAQLQGRLCQKFFKIFLGVLVSDCLKSIIRQIGDNMDSKGGVLLSVK